MTPTTSPNHLNMSNSSKPKSKPSTASKPILDSNRIAYLAQVAKDTNPNRDKIDDLRAQVFALSIEISELTSEEEKYSRLLAAISPADRGERLAMVSLMETQELGDHCAEIMANHLTEGGDEELEWCFVEEILRRAGYVFAGDMDGQEIDAEDR